MSPPCIRTGGLKIEQMIFTLVILRPSGFTPFSRQVLKAGKNLNIFMPEDMCIRSHIKINEMTGSRG